MVLNVGDRVRISLSWYTKPKDGVIMMVDSSGLYGYLSYYVTTLDENRKTFWVTSDEIKLDIGYYRDKQINKIINE